MTGGDGFRVGIEFESVLAAISKQIYETPLAFIRENVQNAVDAIRLQAARQGLKSSDPSFRVSVSVTDATCEITDNGLGMSLGDLRNLFWTIGASGKRTAEARAAGCVGMFGIGGFANLGVCSVLRVTSQPVGGDVGHWTELSRADIKTAGGTIPTVRSGPSSDASPNGTIVRGILEQAPNRQELRSYVEEFVRYAREHIYFDGDLLSRQPFRALNEQDGTLRPIPLADNSWSHGPIVAHGDFYEAPDHGLLAELRDLEVDGESVRLRAWLRFEHGAIEVMKRGFKICTTTISSQIGVSGVIDCDRLSPTAGRDSLDAESSALVASIGSAVERAAVLAVLDSPERIGQHTRIFRYVRTQGLIEHLANVIVELADGSALQLKDIRRRSGEGVRTYYAVGKNRELSHLLLARGHIVVNLPADRDKQIAVRGYLVEYCAAEAFEGRIECTETYSDLTLFERAFLSELEQTITGGYDVASVRLIPGKLTEDVPVYSPESKSGELTVYVDVRHPEITKLERLGISPLLMSMVAAFCREYLASTLRSRSPKFFGSGAVNLDWLAKRRSELWVLLRDDIQVLSHGAQRQVVTASDVRVVLAGPSSAPAQPDNAGKEPRLVRIEGSEEFSELFGYYLRVPTSASVAYGDVILQCDERAVVWAGNKIMFVASDAISSAFQYEVRLDRIVVTGSEEKRTAGGALELIRPLQSLFGGLYFPIPQDLEPYLVPHGSEEIRIEVRCDWIDFVAARAWEARSA